MTDSRLDALALPVAPDAATLVLREDEFRLLYDRTSRALWVYLYRLTRDAHAADDLLQDTYYRFLRTPGHYESEQHERNTLYRIATNLVRDTRRRRAPATVPIDEPGTPTLIESGGADPAQRIGAGADVRRALEQLRDRDQQLLWLAYAEGSSHEEIADTLGLRTRSVKTMLFRARQRLAAVLARRPHVGGVR